MERWQFMGCAVFLLAAFFTDIKTMKIPNKISLSFILSGLAVQLGTSGLEGLWFGLKGFAAGFGIMFLLYRVGAVGGGDVKLFGGIGAWTGTLFVLNSLIYSVMAAGILGLVIMLARGDVVRRMAGLWQHVFGTVLLRSLQPLQESKLKMIRFPFMIAVIPGAAMAYLNM